MRSPGRGEYTIPGVTYLSPEDQEALPYRIKNLLSWDHFGRKNIGYLYAIHHGAKVMAEENQRPRAVDIVVMGRSFQLATDCH